MQDKKSYTNVERKRPLTNCFNVPFVRSASWIAGADLAVTSTTFTPSCFEAAFKTLLIDL